MKLGELEEIVLQFIRSESEIHNFRVRLYESYMAEYRGKPYSSGYFVSPDLDKTRKYCLLAVGIERPTREWVETLLHEYCHFTQYLEQIPLWKESVKLGLKKYPSPSDLKRQHELSIAIEYDCEKRTVRLIKKLKIDHLIDVAQYARRANSYLTFYHVYAKTNKWYDRAPFSIKAITNKMPSKITNPKKLRPNSSLMGLYVSECYNESYPKEF